MDCSAEKIRPDTGRRPAQPSPSVDERLLAAQCRLLYEQTGIAVAGGTVALFLIVFLLREQMPLGQLMLWAGGASALYLLRFVEARRVLRLAEDETMAAAAGLLRRHLLGVLATGSAWGLGGWMLDLASVAHVAMVVVVVAGISAAGLTSYAASRWSGILFAALSLLPLAANLLLASDGAYDAMGMLLLVYVGFLWLVARRMYVVTVDSLRLGIINSDLAAVSLRAREEAERLNAKLKAEVAEHARAEATLRASERELSSILENMQDMYYRTDLEGRVVRVSPSVRELVQYEPEEVLGTSLADYYVPPSNRSRFLRDLKANGGVVHNYLTHVRRKDGSTLWVASNAQYVRDEAGRIIGVEGTTRDVSKLKRTEDALFEAKERAEVTLSSIGDGVITTDTRGRVDYINPVAEQLTGWSQAEALGRPLEEVFRVVDERSREPLSGKVKACLASGRRCAVDDSPILLRRGGGEHSIEASVSPIRNPDGDVTGAVLVFHDVTELRGLARKMSHQATHDALTGLINRAEFERRLEHLLDSALGGDFPEHALMYLDLDQFKLVNDTSGHVAGDELLRQLTAQLQMRVRGSDVLARLGGDEFGVLLENCSLEQALEVAEDLRRITRAFRFEWQGKVFEVGVSIGVVSLDHDSGSLSDVLSAADSACYMAKDLGRNRVHVYTPDDEELAQRHGEMQWVHRVKAALAEDRLSLYCQTAVRLSEGGGGEIYQEILMRMRDEGGRLVPPMAFLPAMERFHLMADLDRWVVKASLHALAGKRSWRENEIFAINLSGQSLGDGAFRDYVVGLLEQGDVPPAHLCFEVTETAAIANLVHATHFIDTLKGMGCHFALDDFGSGLSSFAYLKRLPVDYLKIDGHFVHNIANDAVDHAMVDSINRIGHVFNMRTIAEFAENDEILAILRRLGVDYAQGNGVHKPVPLQDCIDASPIKR